MAEASKRICVAVDESEPSKRALVWAISSFSIGANDRLVLITAIPPPDVAPGQEDKFRQTYEAKRKRGARLLKGFSHFAASRGVPEEVIKADMLYDNEGLNWLGTGQAIVDYLSRELVTTLVVGARGLGALQRSIGSIFGMGASATVAKNIA